ncbi:MAG: hypothetical protein EOP04_07015 [Proteobacteria bacterium]|nr:MAG: hypothetical protein EOP04_07015 [Pseudomonadota bacterium]
MKIKALLLGLLVSTQGFAANDYEFLSVPHSDVDQYLTIGSDETQTPESIQGLWWLNGNPLPDEVLSFANMKWTPIKTDGETSGWESEIPVYDQGIWTWHDSFAGRLLYSLAYKTKLNYHIVFNSDFTHGKITPIVKAVSFLPAVELPPSMLIDFELNYVDENEYSRDSVLLGRPHTYRFRRIVDGQGNRLPAYDEFVEKAEVPNALLPILR